MVEMKTRTKILTGITIAALIVTCVLAASCDFMLIDGNGVYTFPETKRPQARESVLYKDQYITKIVVQDDLFAFFITGIDGENESTEDDLLWSWWSFLSSRPHYCELSDIVLTNLVTDEAYTPVRVQKENGNSPGGAAVVTFKDVEHYNNSRFSLSNTYYSKEAPVKFDLIKLSDAVFSQNEN